MLEKKQRYLQIALNSTLHDAIDIIRQIPLDKRIIIEAGTPLIKTYGARGIKNIKHYWRRRVLTQAGKISTEKIANFFGLPMASKQLKPKFQAEQALSFSPYIVADLKCMDRGKTEVEIAKQGEADAAICLGLAPIETIDSFIEACGSYNLDSMVDMMNVEFPLNILRQLKKLPQVVILHRGVDEESFNKEKEIPFHEIQRIKSNYDIMISIAGGDTFREVERAIFNDADIVIVWKSFYKSTAQTAQLAEKFLKEIR